MYECQLIDSEGQLLTPPLTLIHNINISIVNSVEGVNGLETCVIHYTRNTLSRLTKG